MNNERIADLEVLLGHVFRDKDLLLNALSHSSVKTEDRPSNERLEFLGDSVLGLIVSDALYRRFPQDDEGSLTRIKSHAVSRATLQRIAAAMGLDRFILVGKGVLKREIPASLLGNLFEAMIGAIYLDSGLAAARKFTLRHLDVIIEEIVQDRSERNYKSILQHFCQREHGGVPVYRLLREFGPAHGRNFEVAVILHGKEYGRARAVSKKEAEQGAARAALLYWRAIQESARDHVRGAGEIVSMGSPHQRPPQEERREVRGAAPGASPAAGPPPEGGGGRRGRRRRRGRGGNGEGGEALPLRPADHLLREPEDAGMPQGFGEPAPQEAVPPEVEPEPAEVRTEEPPAPEPEAGAPPDADAHEEGGEPEGEAPEAAGEEPASGPPAAGAAPAGAPRRRRRRGGRGRGRRGGRGKKGEGDGGSESPAPPDSAS